MKKIEGLKGRIKHLLFYKKADPNWESGKYLILILVLLLPLSLLLETQAQKIFIFMGVITSQINLLKLPLKKMLPLNLVFLILVGVSVLSAAWGIFYPLLGLIFLILWIWIYSLLNMVGRISAAISYLGLFLYFYSSIIFLNTLLPPLIWGLYAILGALIGSLAIILVRLIQKDPSKRKILASSFDPEADFKTILLGEKLVESNQKSKTNSLVRLGRKLVILRYQIPHLQDELPETVLKLFQDYKLEFNLTCLNVAEQILHHKQYNLNLEHLNTIYNKIMELAPQGDIVYLQKLVSSFQDLLYKTQAVLRDELLLEPQPLNLSHKISLKDNLKANFHLNNLYIRHGIRFSLAVGTAFLLYLFTGSNDVQWVAISIFLVLKPDIISTQERMILRIIATIVGVSLAVIISLILIYLGLTFLLPLLGLISLVAMIISLPVNYLYVVFFTSLLIIFLEPAPLIPLKGAARIVDVFIGSLIAWAAAYIILPSRLMVNLPGLLQSRISSCREFIVTLIDEDDEESFNDSLQEMISTYNNLQAGIIKLKDSKPQAQEDIKAYQDMALTLDRLSGNFLMGLNHLKKIKVPDKKTYKALLLMVDLLDKLESSLDDYKSNMDTDFKALHYNLQKLKKNFNSEDYLLLFKYGEWLVDDLEILYSLIKDGQNSSLFTRYKQL